MSEINSIVAELGGTDSRLGTNYKGKDVYADAMSLSQAKRLSAAAEGEVSPVSFDSDADFFEIIERITDDWTECELLFGGSVETWGYIDTVWVVYDDYMLDHQRHEYHPFKEYAVLHFKHWMSKNSDDNAGICPFCDDRITLSNETFRYTESDDNLWAAPDEFGFREYDEFDNTLRMWWDD